VPDPATLAEAFASRHIPFEAAFNFRDVGGYATERGGRVRRGRLFRAGALHRMSAADAERARRLRIVSVIDLRRPDERAAVPLGPLVDGGARHHAIDVIPEGGSAILDARYGAGISGPRYVGYLELGAARFAEALRLLAEPATLPAVVHCSAGKDRTGTLVAVLLELLGVARDDVIADYAMSNLDVDRQLGWARAAGALRDDGNREGVDPSEALRRSLLVPVEAIEHFLDHLDRAYGSVAGFAEWIGVDARTVAALRASLVDGTGA